MSRQIAKTIVFAQLEATYGVAPGVITATDAVLIANARFNIERDVVSRDLMRGYYGGSEHLAGTRRANIEFDVELAGSGTAGTAPAWGRLLRGCSMAETITSASLPTDRVEYTPISGGFESLSLHYFTDGVRYVSRGARGNVTFKMNAYERPMLHFAMVGFDTVALEGNVGGNFTAWQRPLVITDANAGDIRLGGSYTTGVISGGTVLASKGLEVDLGNKVSHLKLLGGERIDITAREVTGRMTVELSAADEVTWRSDITTNSLASLGFNFGTVAGNRIAVWAPAVQRVNPQVEDYEGNVMMATELRMLPSAVGGNDDITIVAR